MIERIATMATRGQASQSADQSNSGHEYPANQWRHCSKRRAAASRIRHTTKANEQSAAPGNVVLLAHLPCPIFAAASDASASPPSAEPAVRPAQRARRSQDPNSTG